MGRLLNAAGYSLQSNRKTLEGGQPVISVDTKKKELVGAFKNVGREWRPKGDPDTVKIYDFLDPKLGKAIPWIGLG